MKYHKEDGKYRYVLDENFGYQIDLLDERTFSGYVLLLSNGRLLFTTEYAWDGSSIPFKWLLGMFHDFDKFSLEASLVHDGLYQLMRLGLLDKKHKDYADKLYRNMCIMGGLSTLKADVRYWALKHFGRI